MFEHGGDFDRIFETPAGPVRVFAEIHVLGDHLILDELLFYPERGGERLQIGVSHVLAISAEVQRLAHDAGFRQISVVYHRVGASQDGRTISHTRRLR